MDDFEKKYGILEPPFYLTNIMGCPLCLRERSALVGQYSSIYNKITEAWFPGVLGRIGTDRWRVVWGVTGSKGLKIKLWSQWPMYGAEIAHDLPLGVYQKT